MESVVWAIENGCPWQNEDIFKAALDGGNLALLQWLSQTIDVELNEEYCDLAAYRGHLAVLKWLREKGVPWDEATLEKAFSVNTDQSKIEVGYSECLSIRDE